MISKYLDFIIENTKASNYDTIYWEKYLDDEGIITKDWYDLTIELFKQKIYIIRFAIGTDKYDYRNVIVEHGPKEDLYYLENKSAIDKFTEKMINEFRKDPAEIYKRLKYVPKCLGSKSEIENLIKFNL